MDKKKPNANYWQNSRTNADVYKINIITPTDLEFN